MANKNIFDASLEITKAEVQSGVITSLEVNGHDIPLYEEPEDVILYAWKDSDDNIAYTLTDAPEADGDCYLAAVTGLSSDTIADVAEGEITVEVSGEDVDFSRYEDGDIKLN